MNEDGTPRFPVGQVPEKYRVIRAKKLRGIFSQGMLAPLPAGSWQIGDDVAEAMGITKYEPPESMMIGGECEAAPKGWAFPVYTDIEGLRRYPDILQEGEEVVITEKIHGANGRFVHDGDRLWVGSHTQIKKEDPTSIWWKVAIAPGILLDQHPFLVFFGEVYEQVQDLKYDIKHGVQFRVFDIFDIKTMRYLDHDEAMQVAQETGVTWVPILYRGPWHKDLNALAEGNSTLAINVREGFVVKPIKERWNEYTGRVILKRHGEGYLLRKKK